MDTARYMLRAEEFVARLHTEERLHLSGLKEAFETEAIFDDFQDLFSRQATLQRLEHLPRRAARGQRSLPGRRGAAGGRPPDEDRIGRQLAEFAVHNHIERRLSHLTDRIATAQNAIEVRVGEESVPFCQAWDQLSREPDRGPRRLLEQMVAAALVPENAHRGERIAAQREVARELGFADYLALCEELSGHSVRTLGRQMVSFLDDTERAYRGRIEDALRGAQISPAEATDADLRWLLFAPSCAESFRREGLLAAAEATMTKFGLSLAERGKVHFDLENRPTKYPRPFCAPIRVPGEVWVVASPRGGWVDCLSFFHELGHAQHLACTDPDLPAPCRLMGDDAVSEAFAFLVQSLVLEPEWLGEVMGATASSSSLLALGQLLDFWQVRRYAGKILYELELHRTDGPATNMAPRYASLLARATGVRVSPEHYLFDADDRFHSASYLRAWTFDACLRRYLKERFGPRWFQCPEAGALLRRLWRSGRQFTLEELAGDLGMELSIKPLCERLLAGPEVRPAASGPA